MFSVRYRCYLDVILLRRVRTLQTLDSQQRDANGHFNFDPPFSVAALHFYSERVGLWFVTFVPMYRSCLRMVRGKMLFMVLKCRVVFESRPPLILRAVDTCAYISDSCSCVFYAFCFSVVGLRLLLLDWFALLGLRYLQQYLRSSHICSLICLGYSENTWFADIVMIINIV